MAARFARRLGRDLEGSVLAHYAKIGGWQFTFQITLTGSTWSEQVVEVIGLGQRVGYGWRLSGDVHTMPEGWSNESSVPGVTAIQWQVWPPNA